MRACSAADGHAVGELAEPYATDSDGQYVWIGQVVWTESLAVLIYLPASVFTLHSVSLVLPLVVSDWYMVGQVEQDVAVPPALYVAPVQIEHDVPLTR